MEGGRSVEGSDDPHVRRDRGPLEKKPRQRVAVDAVVVVAVAATCGLSG